MYRKGILLSLLFAFFVNTYSQETHSWYQSIPNDSIVGIGLTGAYDVTKYLKQKPKTIVVAILDSGMDVDHEDLYPQIWKNKKERIDGKDNDKNGYIDDVSGWNFLGKSSDTTTLLNVGTEYFREYKRLMPLYENIDDATLNILAGNEKKEYAYFQQVRKKAGIGSYIKFFEYLTLVENSFVDIDSLMTMAYVDKKTTIDDFRNLHVDSLSIQSYEIVNSKTFIFDSLTIWKDIYKNNIDDYLMAEKRVKSLSDTTSLRKLVGDNEYDINDIYYGNNNLKVDMDHATFVAGIIAATQGNDTGIDGITNHVKVMPVRIVPNGDEYDKDVAVGIKYAVDNGAQIINMSFGKYLSPNSQWVRDAVGYATRNNVLLVHAAGNEGINVDSVSIYPSRYTLAGEASDTFIRVGASNADGDAIAISNYGKEEVDLFAPGYDIYSLSSNNKYMVSQGTSIAAPMVSGVAALIWAYYPKLKANEIKDIILKTVTKRNTQTNLPGKAQDSRVNFSDLSKSGGILNAFDAIKEAGQIQKKVVLF